MPPQPSEFDRELETLEIELRKLEGEYTMYFAGRLPRPPGISRSRVAAMIRRLDNAHIPNYRERFRFTALQSRFAAFRDLWDRAHRAREEGRPGPLKPRGS